VSRARFIKTDLELILDERTRRELFSALAMQAILRSHNVASQTDVAQWVRTYADALIALRFMICAALSSYAFRHRHET
jgi:hypothetical protein